MTVQEHESYLEEWKAAFLGLVKTIQSFPEDEQTEMINLAVKLLNESAERRAEYENNNDC